MTNHTSSGSSREPSPTGGAAVTLLLLVLAAPVLAQGERIANGTVPGVDVELGGLVPTTVQAVAMLFPTERGVVARYNGGQEVRVHDPEHADGLVVSAYARVDDSFELFDLQVLAFEGEAILVTQRLDPSTGHTQALMAEERTCLGMAGDSGKSVRSGATWVTFAGGEEVTISGTAHRTARFEIRGASPGETAPPRQAKGQVATRARWIDLDSGLLVLEAAWYQGADSWLPILVLTGTDVIPVGVLEGDVVGHLRAVLLRAGERTLPEPGDPAIVPLVRDEDIDPDRIPTLPAERPARVIAQEIVVHTGRSPVGGLRSTGEAEARAQQLTRLARKRGVDFGDVARWYSDGATRTQDGIVGTFDARQLQQGDPVVQAAFSMEVGQVSEPIQRGGDLVIVGRRELVEMCAARIIIGHRDSLRALPRRSSRTREEAELLMDEVVRRLATGADFSNLARRYSEAPEATGGGRMGILAPGALDPAAEQRLAATPVGELTGVLDGRYGLTILKRLPVERMQAVIVVVLRKVGHEKLPPPEFDGSGGAAAPEPTDSPSARDEALQRAREIIRELQRPDADARQIARERSDDPRASENGGDTGPLDPDLLPPHLAPIARLPVGGVSSPIETPRGFLVVKRVR